MFEIKEVRLPGVIVPPEAIGMVIMQPYVELTSPDPFRWPDIAVETQLRRIKRTLDIAKQAKHGCEKTHFTIFPEYALPGIRGVKLIDDEVRSDSWPIGSVVIGGTDWLDKREYDGLIQDASTSVTDRNAACQDDQSVNCCVIWAKYRTASCRRFVKRWLQPKMCPNWPEENIYYTQMFQGSCVYVFEASTARHQSPFRFAAVLCFDWIGQLNGGSGSSAILSKLDELRAGGRYAKPIHLVFVPQRNPKPNHPSFPNSAHAFYVSQDYDFVDRNKCAVIFANNAGADRPGTCWERPEPCRENKYGYSCIIFHPNATYDDGRIPPPSYAVRTRYLRGANLLQTCKEALLRENGACIHSLSLQHPSSVLADPSFPRRALKRATVDSMDDGVQDPRVNGLPVPAIVKWTSDRIEKLTPYRAPIDFADRMISAVRRNVIEGFRRSNAKRLRSMLLYATTGMKKEEWRDVDEWSSREENSLKSMIDTLSIIGCATTISESDTPAHASFIYAGSIVDIVVVSGLSHSENLAHAKQFFPGRADRQTLIISCDNNDNVLTDRDKDIYDMSNDVVRCGLHDLKESFAGITVEIILANIRRHIGINNG